MINLEMLARTFVGPAIEITKANIQKKMDDPAIQAVHDKGQPDRENALKRWLESYAALQGFTKEDRRRVVDGMLGFADTVGCHFDELPFEELIKKFDHLHGICGKAVALTKADKERDLVSLTSKGLWCCYPNGVSIFDRFVQNVLWILCKLSQVRPNASTANSGRYAAFADVWFQIYSQVTPIIVEEADRIGYPYKLRVFDRILWVIGQPDYVVDITAIRRLF